MINPFPFVSSLSAGEYLHGCIMAHCTLILTVADGGAGDHDRPRLSWSGW